MWLIQSINKHAFANVWYVNSEYIFLTFPNNENIEKLNTQCPECNFLFNKSYTQPIRI